MFSFWSKVALWRLSFSLDKSPTPKLKDLRLWAWLFWEDFFVNKPNVEHNDQSAFRNSGPKRPFPLRDIFQKRTRKMHQTYKFIQKKEKKKEIKKKRKKGKRSKEMHLIIPLHILVEETKFMYAYRHMITTYIRNYNSVQRFDSGHRLLTTAPVMKWW